MAVMFHDALLQKGVHRLEGTNLDYDALMRVLGNAHVVLLGEASHGTQEFYRERARITKRLIVEKGFTAIAVEADLPEQFDAILHFDRTQAVPPLALTHTFMENEPPETFPTGI